MRSEQFIQNYANRFAYVRGILDPEVRQSFGRISTKGPLRELTY